MLSPFSHGYPLSWPCFCRSFKASGCFVHADWAAVVVAAIYALYHSACYALLYLYPCIHFPEVYLAKHFLLKVASIQNVLKEACFVEAIFCTKVNEQSCIAIIPSPCECGPFSFYSSSKIEIGIACPVS